MARKLKTIANAYLYAKKYVIKKGFANEIDWQDEINYDSLSEKDIIREAAWIILSSGMNYYVVFKKFNELSPIFNNWEYEKNKFLNKGYIISKSLAVFNHGKKIEAIMNFIEFLYSEGLDSFKFNLKIKGVSYLKNLAFFGPATSYHFVKNLGLQFSKPDRHLNRISKKFGFESTDLFCSYLSKKIEEKKSIIDLVFWRYATLDRNYLDHLDRYLIKSNYY